MKKNEYALTDREISVLSQEGNISTIDESKLLDCHDITRVTTVFVGTTKFVKGRTHRMGGTFPLREFSGPEGTILQVVLDND
jgi:hypothetical protein